MLPDGAVVYAGDGVSGVYAWGLQLSQGTDLRIYAETTSAAAGPFLFNPPSVLSLQSAAWAAVSASTNNPSSELRGGFMA